MKISKILLLSLSTVMIASPVWAQSALEAQVESLREDLQVIQRQMYRDNSAGIKPASAAEVAVKMGEFDENLRTAVGKIDEMEFKIKSLNERIDLLNKDMDIRMKMLEGKPIEGGNASSDVTPMNKYKAPVASEAPKSIVGDAISSGDDLPAVKTATAEELYQQGLEALKISDYPKAEQNFASILKKYPNDKLAGNAQYWQGEVYYGRKDFTKAAVAFAKGLDKYKTGVKGADSLLKLGMSLRELGKKEEACTAFMSMSKEYPSAGEELKIKAASQANALGCK